jgi:phage shock protein PspC (stress-responsive transcriptional regulator)
MNVENRRLYRSRTDRMISGVAGGLGEYLNIDVTIVRLLFVFFAWQVALVYWSISSCCWWCQKSRSIPLKA